jgi:hypothetical protein
MLGEFETVEIAGERLRIRLFDSRCGGANLHGRRWPWCVFDEVTTEAVALPLSFDLWHDVAPCWMGWRAGKEVADELIRYQKQVGRELTAEEVEEIHRSPKMHAYIRWKKKCFEHDSKRLRAEGWMLVDYKPENWRWERK